MEKYETPDIWIASGLFANRLNCKVERIGEFPNGKGKYLFIFEAENEEQADHLKSFVDKYNRGEFFVDIKTLQTAYKTLKNLTF